MHITAVIDRMEGATAVLLVGEKEESIRWPKSLLPDGAKEGDLLRLTLAVDRVATRQARQEADDLLRQLLEQQTKGHE